ncbi:hypothetical protein [Ichthyenterobacterium magnum]|uniref:Uncharacterized protein n=1 Tax=Ichthyenterobacterium magnum TaxID=1230530 RepID=A0A420DLY8_9FLAO|nr:hypothetical protein [Ichthyenterobacterium magnum]RKE95205.1 hypothetical protein BXY80_1391 [Ichthyenterobacterium magnum]
MLLYTHQSYALVTTTQLTIVLIITASIFAFLIGVAIIKMYRLKAENKKLSEMSGFKSDVEKSYKDFTDGHLYDNN